MPLQKLRLVGMPPHPEFALRVRKFRPLPASRERYGAVSSRRRTKASNSG